MLTPPHHQNLQQEMSGQLEHWRSSALQAGAHRWLSTEAEEQQASGPGRSAVSSG